MIKIENGRARSIRTPEEVEAQIQADIGRLTPAELETLKIILRELREEEKSAEDQNLLSVLTQAEYKTVPVDIRTFIKDPYFLGKTCSTLYPKLQDDLVELFDGGYQEAILGGCVAHSTLIQGADGSLRTLGERLGTSDPVQTLSDTGLKSSTYSVVKDSGVKKVVTVTVANGMAVTLTPDHLVRVYKEGTGYVWVPAGDLVEGDLVVAARRMRTTPSSTLSSSAAKLLAYLCTDGSSDEYRARFSDGNPETSKDASALLRELGFDGFEIDVGANCWGIHTKNSVTSGFISWLQEHGGHYRTADVRVPDSVCRASNDVVAAFLNRVWAAEGCVYVSSKSPPRFTLAMVAERFIREVQLLLLRFDVQARIKPIVWKDKRSGKESHGWILTVSGRDNLVRFMEAIGPILGKEAECEAMRKYCDAKKGNTNVDTLPITYGYLNDRMVAAGIKKPAKSKWWRLSVNRECRLSRAMFDSWLQVYRGTDLATELEAAFSKDLAYEPVFSVKFQDQLVPTGDVCDVVEGRRFVSSGICTHNSIGWGKTFFASIGICRILYEISCLKDPHASYGISPDSNIAIVAYSVNAELARKVAFENIVTKITASPYFQENFPFEPTKEEFRFPNSVWLAPRATTPNAALGLNIISAFIDEADFMGSKKTAKGVESTASAIYAQVQRRIKSRFDRKGKLPGMLFLVSSKKSTDDFTQKRVKEALNDPTIFTRDYASWMVKPDEYFTQKRFWVLCGNADIGSKIIPEDEVEKYKLSTPEGAVLLDVPEDFRADFERDLEGAIRDIGGISTVSIRPYIQRREKIKEAVDPGLQHPFSTQVYDLSKGGTFMWDRMVTRRRERAPGRIEFDKLRPIINPTAARHVHIDLGLRKDALGLSMAHISGWKDVIRRSDDGREFVEQAPVYTVDLMLKIIPPAGGEIVFSEARHLVYDLVQHGYVITCISFDSWQSVDSIQQFAAKGLNAVTISVDTDPLPYDTLKMALYENRIRMYQYDPVMQELAALEEDLTGRKRKIDHPKTGCFVGTTRIPLLDGSHPTIEELSDGREVWVYSATPDGRIVPGKARGRRTKFTRHFVDVILDSGAVERCTPEHLWMLRDGTYKPAKDLRPGIDRLMPISRVWPVNGGYERVTNSHGERVLTHHMAWSALNGSIPLGMCVHHRNHEKLDNRPENLELASLSEHSRSHTSLRHATDPEYRTKLYKGLSLFNNSEEGRRKHAEAVRRTTAARTPEERQAYARKRDAFRHDIDLDSLERIRNDSEAVNANSAARILGCGRNVVVRVLREHGYESWAEFERSQPGTNHKVRAVIPVELTLEIPVYDLEVDGWSNFALASGVFVHNSKDCSDALAGAVFTLSTQQPVAPLPIVRGASYQPQTWMDEQRQSAMAGNSAAGSQLMPFYSGGIPIGGGDPWGDL